MWSWASKKTKSFFGKGKKAEAKRSLPPPKCKPPAPPLVEKGVNPFTALFSLVFSDACCGSLDFGKSASGFQQQPNQRRGAGVGRPAKMANNIGENPGKAERKDSPRRIAASPPFAAEDDVQFPVIYSDEGLEEKEECILCSHDSLGTKEMQSCDTCFFWAHNDCLGIPAQSEHVCHLCNMYERCRASKVPDQLARYAKNYTPKSGRQNRLSRIHILSAVLTDGEFFVKVFGEPPNLLKSGVRLRFLSMFLKYLAADPDQNGEMSTTQIALDECYDAGAWGSAGRSARLRSFDLYCLPHWDSRLSSDDSMSCTMRSQQQREKQHPRSNAAQARVRLQHSMHGWQRKKQNKHAM